MMWLPREIAPNDRLGVGGLFGIWRLDEARKRHALAFIASWSADDAYDRFGSAGIGGPEWLTHQLTQYNRDALIAVNASAVVGLLDYVSVDNAIHIGIVVDAPYRKLSIGTMLVQAMLQSRPLRLPVIADCSSRNYAAVNLLRSCRFSPVSIDCGDITWRYD